MKHCLVITCLLFTFSSCKPIKLYLENNKPVFFQNSFDTSLYSDSISLLTYNIEYGQHCREVSHWLNQHYQNQQTKLVFLQEVSEQDVELIAKKLSLNYVYYPISFEKKYQKNFGNAILSNLSILGHEKLILGQKKPFNGRKRSVTYARLKNGEDIIHTYCVHLETIVMPPKLRMEQLKSLTNHIGSLKDPHKIIVAGDFNCISYDMRKNYRSILSRNNLLELTTNIDPSLTLFLGIPARTDLVFGSGFCSILERSHQHKTWSDHSAIEVKLISQ